MDEKEQREMVGRRVREERRAAGIDLEGLANRVEVDASYLSRIERGERGLDSLLLARIADALEVPMDAFFDAERGKVLALARGGEDVRDPMVTWALDLLADIEYAERVVTTRGW